MSLAVRCFFVLLLSPLCWCQQPPSHLTARTLFYRENPDNDQLPPAPTTRLRKAKKVDTAKHPAVAGTATASGSNVAEPKEANAPVANQESARAGEPGTSGPSVVPVVEHLGLRYSLLLIDRNNNSIIEAADPARTFHEGDCVALEFQPNRSGYLYVLEEGSSGAWKALFPSPQLPDESNIVRAQNPVRVPGSACFGIHPPQGVERVFVILTRNPENVSKLEESIRQQSSGAKTELLAENVNRLRTEMENRLATRDLEIETIAQPQAAGERRYSVYVANASNVAYDQLSAEIQIKHN